MKRMTNLLSFTADLLALSWKLKAEQEKMGVIVFHSFDV